MISNIKNLFFQQQSFSDTLPVPFVAAVLDLNKDSSFKIGFMTDLIQHPSSDNSPQINSDLSTQIVQLIKQTEQSSEDNDYLTPLIDYISSNNLDQEMTEDQLVRITVETAQQQYKAKNGLQQIQQQEMTKQQWVQIIQKQIVQNCRKHYEKFSLGFELLNQINESNLKQCEAIKGLRSSLQRHRMTVIQKAKVIISKQKQIQRVKYTIEKIQILNATFGPLFKALQNISNNEDQIGAYQIIPLMKQAQLKIEKYKLYELKLACMNYNQNEDFFEDKIEFIKMKVGENVDKCFLLFDESKYFASLQSYFYLQVRDSLIKQEILQHETISRLNLGEHEKKYKGPTFECIQKLRGVQLNNLLHPKLKQTAYHLKIITNTYRHLNNILQLDQIVNFCRILCYQMGELFVNFYLCNRFHQNYLLQMEDDVKSSDQKCVVDSKFIEQQSFAHFLESLRQQYIDLRQPFWDYIQNKLSKIINNMNQLQLLPIEEFIYIYSYFSMLIKRAEDICQGSSKMYLNIQLYLKNRYQMNILQFHKLNLKNVYTYVYNEEFQRLPIINDSKFKSNFAIILFLKKNIEQNIFRYFYSQRLERTPHLNTNQAEIQQFIENESQMKEFFLYDHQNPFQLPDYEFDLIKKSVWPDNRMLQLNQNKQNYNLFEIVFTATSIKIFQMMPQYLIYSFYQHNQAVKICDFILQLFKKYLYFSFKMLLPIQIQKFFIEKIGENVQKYEDSHEAETIQSYDILTESMILQQRYKKLQQFVSSAYKESIDLYEMEIFSKEKKDFIDLSERTMAIESMNFLVQQLLFYYTSIVGDGDLIAEIKDKIEDFQLILNEFQELLYKSYISTFIKIDPLLQPIVSIKWEIKQPHNENKQIYLDRLILFIFDVREKLESISGGSIPLNAQKVVFHCLILQCLQQMLEFYAKVKKVNQIGREQMLQDYQYFYTRVNHNQILPTQSGEEYIRIFNTLEIQQILEYIFREAATFPMRMMVQLLTINPAYSNLKRIQKKELLSKIYTFYFEILKLCK